MFNRHLSADMEPWRLHAVRRSVGTGMADIGIAPHVVEQVLNQLVFSHLRSGQGWRAQRPAHAGRVIGSSAPDRPRLTG